MIAPVRDLLMLRGCGSGRPAIEGEALGEVDMRSWSAGSSEAFRFRFDMLGVVKGSERNASVSVDCLDAAQGRRRRWSLRSGVPRDGEKRLLARRCGANK